MTNDNPFVEEQIGDEAAERRKRGESVRFAAIAVAEFHAMRLRLNAKVEFDGDREHVTLYTAGGRVVVRPSADAAPDQIAWSDS